ncbi:uncharacterized protein OCT59_019314 [Rhizophagus irregularis]|uniref:Uncharacterized protein n=1 Tax=Rhizophagus irregularis TaxID=588596 RepID=A0A915ZXI1_9GLOM|nr:hypothetical protein OCT59_019314 [Rhizophagus irregularis]CAB4471422.1 unnamed protein product [Rhizophagus irregularis]CAB5388301.1 unnamed protein product [Rhizophagus irregularis]CAB5392565.1 unnamed protein product [Rhizophagus irregularis]
MLLFVFSKLWKIINTSKTISTSINSEILRRIYSNLILTNDVKKDALKKSSRNQTFPSLYISIDLEISNLILREKSYFNILNHQIHQIDITLDNYVIL